MFLTEKLPGLDMSPLFILFEYKFSREEVFTFREVMIVSSHYFLLTVFGWIPISPLAV